MLFMTGNNGLTCNNNADCPSNLICDGNLKTCRKHARDQSYQSNFCGTYGRLCQEMEGDCDHDNECEGSLECGSDNCNQFDYPPGADCCSAPGNIMRCDCQHHITSTTHSQFQSPHTAMATSSHVEMGIASKEDGSVTVMTTAVTIRMNNIALGTMDNPKQLFRHNSSTSNIHILIFG